MIELRISPRKKKTIKPVSESEYSTSDDDYKASVKRTNLQKKRKSKRTLDKKVKSFAESSYDESSSDEDVSVISKNRTENGRVKNHTSNKNDSTQSKKGQKPNKAADLNLNDALSDNFLTPTKNKKEKNAVAVSKNGFHSPLSGNNKFIAIKLQRLDLDSIEKGQHISSTKKPSERTASKRVNFYVESYGSLSSSDEEDLSPTNRRGSKNRITQSSDENDTYAEQDQSKKKKISRKRKASGLTDAVRNSSSNTKNYIGLTRKQSNRSPGKKVKSYAESPGSDFSSDEENAVPTTKVATQSSEISETKSVENNKKWKGFEGRKRLQVLLIPLTSEDLKQYKYKPSPGKKVKSYAESSGSDSSIDEEYSLSTKNRTTLSSEESDSNEEMKQSKKEKFSMQRKRAGSFDTVKTSPSKIKQHISAIRKQSERSRKKVKSYAESSGSDSSSFEKGSLQTKNPRTKNRVINLSPEKSETNSEGEESITEKVSRQRRTRCVSDTIKAAASKTKKCETRRQSERFPSKNLNSYAESSGSDSLVVEEYSLPTKNRRTLSSEGSDSNEEMKLSKKDRFSMQRKALGSHTVKTSPSKAKKDRSAIRKQSERSPSKKVKSYAESSGSDSSVVEEYSLPTKNRTTLSSEESDSNEEMKQSKKDRFSMQRKAPGSSDTVKTSPSKAKKDRTAIRKRSERSPRKKVKSYAESSGSDSSSDEDDYLPTNNRGTKNRVITLCPEENATNSVGEESITEKVSGQRKAPVSSDTFKTSPSKAKNDRSAIRKQSERSPSKKVKSYAESSASDSSVVEEYSLPTKNRTTLSSEESDSNEEMKQSKKDRFSMRRKAPGSSDTVKTSPSKAKKDRTAIRKQSERSTSKKVKSYAELSGSGSSSDEEDSLPTKNRGMKNRVITLFPEKSETNSVREESKTENFPSRRKTPDSFHTIETSESETKKYETRKLSECSPTKNVTSYEEPSENNSFLDVEVSLSTKNRATQSSEESDSNTTKDQTKKSKISGKRKVANSSDTIKTSSESKNALGVTRKQSERSPRKKMKSYAESSESSASDKKYSLPTKNRDTRNRAIQYSEENDSNSSNDQSNKRKILEKRERKGSGSSDTVKIPQSETKSAIDVRRNLFRRSPRKKGKFNGESPIILSSSDEENSLLTKNRDTKNRANQSDKESESVAANKRSKMEKTSAKKGSRFLRHH